MRYRFEQRIETLADNAIMKDGSPTWRTSVTCTTMPA
jgi:hypothetical protein